MEQAYATLTGTNLHLRTQLLMDEFLRTPYGTVARWKLLVVGRVHIPLFQSEREAREKAELQRSCVAEFIEDTQGSVKKSWLRRVYDIIKSQLRFMLPPAHIGPEFERIAKESETTVKHVLHALVRSGYDAIIVEKGTCLVSLEGIYKQASYACL